MDLAEKILRLAAEHSGRRPEQVDRADIFGAGKLAGDDADEFLDAFIQTYGVDFTGFRDYLHYDGNEPPGWFRTSWGVGTDGKRLAIVPISLTDLVRAAKSGKWQMEYPAHRLVDRGRIYFWIFPLVVLCFVLLIAPWRASH
ncbi:MAG: DUF1493 family protein [Pseudomonadota bacterium]